ncbi:Cap protein [Porcine associated porprismacovirus 5]|uniref:Cap protein n=1 Tax=Porcine associated porprismacovirus 5 TaxID=2170121 RepID=A0A076VEN2_9VIRU|nr:Cap protein [Porcine associated porprismacovirus 5]AIK28867.1 Cap protein [Porcine associated porprismacovirus 5]
MATNYVTAKYQEIYDLGTQAGKTTILGIHTPDGGNVYNMLSGFFDQFRKYRYKGCSVSMVPAAQLPADPLQVSFEAGALTCDPRDLLNPILFHGCHGEELNEILDSVYYKGTSPSSVRELQVNTQVSEASYYAALSDPSFRKFGIQQGAKVSLRPMVHPLAVTQPIEHSDSKYYYSYPSGGTTVTGSVDGVESGDLGMVQNGTNFTRFGLQDACDAVELHVSGAGIPSGSVYVSPTKTIFSNGLKPLSWLPTWHFVPYAGENMLTVPYQNRVSDMSIETTRLPLLYMGLFILPPSYTQEMYFRLIITHYFEFKDFSTCLTRHSVDQLNPDRKVYTETIPEPTSGSSASSLTVVDGSAVQTSEGVY